MLQRKPSRASGNSQEIETGYVVGADIGGTSLRLALAGMDGGDQTEGPSSGQQEQSQRIRGGLACCW